MVSNTLLIHTLSEIVIYEGVFIFMTTIAKTNAAPIQSPSLEASKVAESNAKVQEQRAGPQPSSGYPSADSFERVNTKQAKQVCENKQYTVKEGDCLIHIAQKQNVDLQKMKDANPHLRRHEENEKNGHEDFHLIHPGEKVNLPDQKVCNEVPDANPKVTPELPEYKAPPTHKMSYENGECRVVPIYPRVPNAEQRKQPSMYDGNDKTRYPTRKSSKENPPQVNPRAELTYSVTKDGVKEEKKISQSAVWALTNKKLPRKQRIEQAVRLETAHIVDKLNSNPQVKADQKNKKIISGPFHSYETHRKQQAGILQFAKQQANERVQQYVQHYGL